MDLQYVCQFSILNGFQVVNIFPALMRRFTYVKIHSKATYVSIFILDAELRCLNIDNFYSMFHDFLFVCKQYSFYTFAPISMNKALFKIFCVDSQYRRHILIFFIILFFCLNDFLFFFISTPPAIMN